MKHLNANERNIVSLTQQNFKNYLLFNIPYSDIFKRKIDLNYIWLGEKWEERGPLVYYNSSELNFPPEGIDYNERPDQIAEEWNNSLAEQEELHVKSVKRLQQHLDKSSTREKLSLVLDRWDT